MARSIAVIVCLLCMLLHTQRVQSVSEYPKLLVVSYDGFRWDYLARNLTSIMNEMKNNGTHADRMMNAFSTKTYPNHHTMATGFYAETHGVLDAEVYVPNRTIGDSPELFHYDNNVLPIWTLNEQTGKGRHSGAAMWPGSQYAYNGTLPAFIEQFNMSVPWKSRVDTMISWFLDPSSPINFGVLYIEEPDFHGHVYGINAPVIDEMLKKLDAITEYLHGELRANNLSDVNVVHLSDHGMISVTIDRIVNISSYIEHLAYRAVSKNTIIMITPDQPGNEDIIYEKLKAAAASTSKFDVYKRSEVPKRYHFGDNPRVGDIVVSARSGYAFEDLYNTLKYYEKTFNITVNNQSEFGLHGYDNEDTDMHPIFFARGPAFVDKCKLEPFHNVDLFPLFCKILELKCPPVNGTLKSFSKCLTSADPMMAGSNVLAVVVSCVLVIVAINILVVIVIRRRRKLTRTQGRRPYEEIG